MCFLGISVYLCISWPTVSGPCWPAWHFVSGQVWEVSVSAHALRDSRKCLRHLSMDPESD